jgi:hypothetical protein
MRANIFHFDTGIYQSEVCLVDTKSGSSWIFKMGLWFVVFFDMLFASARKGEGSEAQD